MYKNNYFNKTNFVQSFKDFKNVQFFIRLNTRILYMKYFELLEMLPLYDKRQEIWSIFLISPVYFKEGKCICDYNLCFTEIILILFNDTKPELNAEESMN